jgi:hypothetical protein
MEKSLDRRITTRLSLAVSLIDDYTKKEEILGKAKVSMPSLRLEAVKNLSGYYIFCDLPDDTYSIQIESDYYMDLEVADIVIPASEYAEETVYLPPGPSYPFPSWATLIRGTVKDSLGNSIGGAAVEVNMPESPPYSEYTVRTKTTSRGQFVLYFPVWQESVPSQTVVVASTTATGVIEKCKTTTMSVTI